MIFDREGRYGEIWAGRRPRCEIWGGTGGDMGRYGEIWGDGEIGAHACPLRQRTPQRRPPSAQVHPRAGWSATPRHPSERGTSERDVRSTCESRPAPARPLQVFGVLVAPQLKALAGWPGLFGALGAAMLAAAAVLRPAVAIEGASLAVVR